METRKEFSVKPLTVKSIIETIDLEKIDIRKTNPKLFDAILEDTIERNIVNPLRMNGFTYLIEVAEVILLKPWKGSTRQDTRLVIGRDIMAWNGKPASILEKPTIVFNVGDIVPIDGVIKNAVRDAIEDYLETEGEKGIEEGRKYGIVVIKKGVMIVPLSPYRKPLVYDGTRGEAFAYHFDRLIVNSLLKWAAIYRYKITWRELVRKALNIKDLPPLPFVERIKIETFAQSLAYEVLEREKSFPESDKEKLRKRFKKVKKVCPEIYTLASKLILERKLG